MAERNSTTGYKLVYLTLCDLYAWQCSRLVIENVCTVYWSVLLTHCRVGMWSDCPSIPQHNSLCCNVQCNLLFFKYHLLFRTHSSSTLSVLGINYLQYVYWLYTVKLLLSKMMTILIATSVPMQGVCIRSTVWLYTLTPDFMGGENTWKWGYIAYIQCTYRYPMVHTNRNRKCKKNVLLFTVLTSITKNLHCQLTLSVSRSGYLQPYVTPSSMWLRNELPNYWYHCCCSKDGHSNSLDPVQADVKVGRNQD